MKNKNWNKIFNIFLQKNNITIKEAAVKTKIPYSTMCAYLNGSRTPSDKKKRSDKKEIELRYFKSNVW